MRRRLVLFIFIVLFSACASLGSIHQILSGNRTNIILLSDGTVWKCANNAAQFPARGYHVSLVFNDKMWVMAGRSSSFYNDVWSSSDGTNWTAATLNADFVARQFSATVVFNNVMWIFSGNGITDDAWYSYDGINWTNATASGGYGGRGGHTALNYHGYIWLIGGSGRKDVWYSPNGTNWYCATNDAAFGVRGYHTSVVFNDKMWVIGGNTTGMTTNSVWCSADGTNWECVSTNPAFEQKAMHSSVVYDDKIWIMCSGGGGPPIEFTNDVWYSSDGMDWDNASISAQFTPRDVQTSVVFKNRMWLIAGLEVINGTPTYKNDVWYSELP